MSKFPVIRVTLDKIVGGGQALGTYEDGRKVFVWGGLPGEIVDVQVTKKRSKLLEGRVVAVIEPSDERINARDPDSFLSTSPWQMMDDSSESHYKAALIEEAFELHDIVLPEPITVHSDDRRFEYRNKVEFSWYWHTDTDQLDLAFFVRGSKGKIPVEGTSLAHPSINQLAREIRNYLRTTSVQGRNLKTLLIRCDQKGNCVWQLYVKDEIEIPDDIMQSFTAQGGEVIYSEPRSPASVITKRLQSYGNVTLSDTLHGVPFRYATEGFFQINLPVYERTLQDMSAYITDAEQSVIDFYSGVGSIGLTIGGSAPVLVESNEHAVREMQRNIEELGLQAQAVHAEAEKALDSITSDSLVILDPPRAGLHPDVIARLLEMKPPRVLYLSCNPVTQARDIALLAESYGIRRHQGYNFFPCTPHIEHFVVLDRR